MNIYGKNGDGECSKRKLLPEERSVLDDYLDLAEISPIRGKVCIAKNIGYTQEQLSDILKTPLEIIRKSEKKLASMNIITIDDNRVITIVNWKHYQSEYERQLPYRVTRKGYKKGLRSQSDTESDTDVDVDKDKKNDGNTDLHKEALRNQKLDCKYKHYTYLKDKGFKETNSLLNMFCAGMERKIGCLDPQKCEDKFRELLDSAVGHKPDNLYGYFHGCITHYLKGEGYKEK
jgi:hypothetical protein